MEKKIVIMFPGQGSQKLGMGAGLFERFPRECTEAHEILGYSVPERCLEEVFEKELSLTLYTQPLLYVVNALSFLAWQEDEGLSADIFIGHSLGEYNALLAADVFSFREGLILVKERSACMTSAGEKTPGAMAAVLGLDDATVHEAIQNETDVQVANYNSQKQVILSGKKERIEALAAVFKEKKARRYLPLPVSGAFHSRYMDEASVHMLSFMQNVRFQKPKQPVYSNLHARPYPLESEAEMKDVLAKQINSPVRWKETVLAIRKEYAGAEIQFKECGPGSVLSGLLRNIP